MSLILCKVDNVLYINILKNVYRKKCRLKKNHQNFIGIYC